MNSELRSATLYNYQEADIRAIFDHMESALAPRILYQLPTGGGKTVVFSEIAKRFIERYQMRVTVLTHRKELCRQTSKTLKTLGIKNKIIGSTSKNLKSDCACYVAMVETLKNRIKSNKIKTHDIGLVIIDEAHHNSFRKLMGNFKHATIVGVTATPFSSDVTKPMNKHYRHLVIGENIATLIQNKFLAEPKSYSYPVELNTLRKGIHGDYSVSSSNELYGTVAMLDLLLAAYRERAEGKKTLIFNNGIDTSQKVYELFARNGIAVRHLDNKTPDNERKQILAWFKKTKGAVLTSVSILTTGFDEPTIQAVILNRATTSITLYHQMIGRGSRRLPSKKTFTIIDLGNNIDRFGTWETPVDWKFVFENPEAFAQQLHYHGAGISSVQSHGISSELRSLFPKTIEMTFDVEAHYHEAIEHDKKPKTVIRQSIRQHAMMCMENSESVSDAITLAQALRPEIEWRVKQYVKCIGNATKNYKEWLLENYEQSLQIFIRKLHARFASAA